MNTVRPILPVAITGYGIVSAIGLDADSVAASLQRRHSGIRAMQYLPSCHRELPVGEVKLSCSQMKEMLGIADSQEVSRTALLGMLAVGQALRHASLQPAPGRRIILVSGTTVGGMDITEQHFATLAHSDEHIGCLARHDCGSTTEAIARHFGIFHDSTTVSTACTSAAGAIAFGARLLQAGMADVVVAGGCEAMSLFHLNGFRSLMILDSQPCRPFDAHRGGLNLGEGAAYIVMEAPTAVRVQPLAWLTGHGNACDAYHPTASSPQGEGAFLAMRQAIASAGLTPGDISYVNAHGTGTPDNDQSESTALQRIFGPQLPPVSSTKGFTGHATSAAGAIEAVVSLLALRHGFIPANLGWTTAMPAGITPTTGQTSCTLRHVLSNSLAFGGNAVSLVFSAALPERQPARPANSHCNATLAKRELSTVIAKPHSQSENSHCNATLAKRERSTVVTDASSLSALRRYVSPLQTRRMGVIMQSALLTSLQALEAAGLSRPDAIITATPLGCLDTSERLLRQLHEEGETMLRQSLFMQSTHNALSTTVAIHTRCHGYNTTYSHGPDSLRWALTDARLLLRSGQATSVLVSLQHEATPLYRSVMARLGHPDIPPLQSLAILLTCGD